MYILIDYYLALQTLDQMADCHSGRDGVRVDDDVRCDSLAGERHVLQHRTQSDLQRSPAYCFKINKSIIDHLINDIDCLPPVCTGSHRFLSVRVGWQTCLRSEESGQTEPAGNKT